MAQEIGSNVGDWCGQSIVSVDQFSGPALELVWITAMKMKDIVEARGTCEILKSKILANVFYEASTRTSCSFHAAMLRLGGAVVPVSASSSSVKKGETLGDTMKTMECYCDAIVLRHPAKGSAVEAASAVDVPVLNAGDGSGEHPTQALLDLVTICAERKAGSGKDAVASCLKGLTIAMVGDLKHGRTVHSLAKLLAPFGASIVCVSPEGLGMPEEVLEAARAKGSKCSVAPSLAECIGSADVVYVTRVQRERFGSEAEYLAAQGSYVVDAATMSKAKEDCVLMHPLPRVGEILEEVDSDPRAAYFRQMRYGLYTRMALLSLLLGGEGAASGEGGAATGGAGSGASGK